MLSGFLFTGVTSCHENEYYINKKTVIAKNKVQTVQINVNVVENCTQYSKRNKGRKTEGKKKERSTNTHQML